MLRQKEVEAMLGAEQVELLVAAARAGQVRLGCCQCQYCQLSAQVGQEEVHRIAQRMGGEVCNVFQVNIVEFLVAIIDLCSRGRPSGGSGWGR